MYIYIYIYVYIYIYSIRSRGQRRSVRHDAAIASKASSSSWLPQFVGSRVFGAPAWDIVEDGLLMKWGV